MTKEQEVEKLLKEVLPLSGFAGKVKAVGGYVRDEYVSHLSGEVFPAKDLDLLVDAGEGGAEKLSKYLANRFPDSLHTPRQMGACYPIWQLVFKGSVEFNRELFVTNGAVIEIAETMQERFPDENSRQREVCYGTFEEDIKRRDFTINMLTKDIVSGVIEDNTGVSKSDVEEKLLRSHPEVSPTQMFSDDPLRMLRMVRFSAVKGYTPTESLTVACREVADRIKIVSQERIYGELEKIANSGSMFTAVLLMEKCGLLEHIFPEVAALKGVEQDDIYHEEGCVLTHTVMVLRKAKPGLVPQMAALLHDVGKPLTQSIEGDRIHFKRHESIGAKMAKDILQRMKFPNEVTDRVVFAVENHMRPLHVLTGRMPDRSMRRFVRDMEGHEEDVLDLANADSEGRIPSSSAVNKFNVRLAEFKEKERLLGLEPGHYLNGNEVKEALGIPTGHKVGEAMSMVHDIVDDVLERGQELSKPVVVKLLQEKWKEL